jgi:2-methylisocitrate lyase-like PEP mutase family enzyme
MQNPGPLGFEALAPTSLGLANARGSVDDTLASSREKLIANCREIALATELPVNAEQIGRE